MSTQQPEALPALIERFRGLHFDHAPDGWPAVRTREITALLDRITELESQLAQRFDAADMATAAAQGFRDGATATAQPVAERHYGPLRDADAEYGQQLSVYSTPRAQPAQQVVAYAALPDERAAFEAQFPVPGGVHWDGTEYVVKDSYVNSYRCDRFVGQWEAWKARAARARLEGKP